MTLVKICGISDPRHALVAVEAGADMIGLVFYQESRRNVTPEIAREVRDAVDGTPLKVVGLFVNEKPDRINRIADEVGLDIIQLSGDETPEIAADIERPVIGTIRVDSSGRSDEEGQFRHWQQAEPAPWAVLLDAHVPGMYGGTGTVADWFVAADIARRGRIVLAGGLRSDNVAAAIRAVKPFAVDVSSGVETNGAKDADKIRAFIHAAKETPITAGTT
mgnify:CR=1 FL=1